MKPSSKISDIEKDHDVDVYPDLEAASFGDCVLTNAGELVRVGYGHLQCGLEMGVGRVYLPMEDFRKLKTLLAPENVGVRPAAKRGRPAVPSNQRASEQIQLRVTAGKKAFYVRAALKKRMKLSAWMFSVCDVASGYNPKTGG